VRERVDAELGKVVEAEQLVVGRLARLDARDQVAARVGIDVGDPKTIQGCFGTTRSTGGLSA
jgi:hypothetical protein